MFPFFFQPNKRVAIEGEYSLYLNSYFESGVEAPCWSVRALVLLHENGRVGQFYESRISQST